MPGTFTYTPAAIAILDAGRGQTLSVRFTPQDGTDYTTAAATTTFTVTKATPILKVADAGGGRFDGSPFPASATIAGAVAGVDSAPASSLDNVTLTLTYYDGSGTAGTSLGPTPPSAPGTYAVVAAFPGNVDYSAILSTPLTFTIVQGAAALALASSGRSAVWGQPVSFIAARGRRRRHAERHGHILRRHHSAGHGPARWGGHGVVHHLGAIPRFPSDHRDLQRRR